MPPSAEPRSSPYPYSRLEEMSWSVEECNRSLSSLVSSVAQKSGVRGLHRQSSGVDLLHTGLPSDSPHLLSALRSRYGRNVLPTSSDDDPDAPPGGGPSCLRKTCLSVLSAIAAQLKEPLILLLLVSALISYLCLHNTADALSILAALAIVCTVAAVQEHRSEDALARLRDVLPRRCAVLRSGRRASVDVADVVLGDVIFLATGDRVPADVRLVDATEFSTDESALTGEPGAVAKSAASPASSTGLTSGTPPVASQSNVALAGTLVASGHGRGIAVAVGRRTEFGQACAELAGVDPPRSPLQQAIDELGRKLACGSVAAIAAIGAVGAAAGRPVLETATVAVSLAVAAIPEGLPICVTVTLALGVLRMAQRRAIVKRLPAVEVLGCASVVCSDKTGTLTQNEMTCRQIFCLAFPNSTFRISGVGYDTTSGGGVTVEGLDNPTGPGVPVGRESVEHSVLSALLGASCICNNASLGSTSGGGDGDGGTAAGQPTELALLVAAARADVGDARSLYVRTGEVPFTSDRKRMEVEARPAGGTHAVPAFAQAAGGPDAPLRFVKGAPDELLRQCSAFAAAGGEPVALTDTGRRKVRSRARRMASAGMRVLAVAYGRSGAMVFAGIVGMEDPPRVGVTHAVAELRRSGVRVVMITGDARETAWCIAQRVGIVNADLGDRDVLEALSADSLDTETHGPQMAISGEELETMHPKTMPQAVAEAVVFYRVAPRHKLMIVKALQGRGEVVAMTGDGVNDATALKAADIGISMGRSGTDVAREASDMVLVDDDFSTICVAVKEGKGIFANIRNFITFQLSTSFAALAMESIATLLGLPSPLNAMQILWINIIMDGPPAQSLGVEPVDGKILAAKPRRASDPIVTRALMRRVLTSAALIVFGTLRVYFHELEDGAVTRRDTTMTFMTFVNFDLFHAYACRSSDTPIHRLGLFSNPAFVWSVGGSVAGQLAVVYFPPLQRVFQTEALSCLDMLYIVMLGSSILVLDYLRKQFFPGYFGDARETPFEGSRDSSKLRVKSPAKMNKSPMPLPDIEFGGGEEEAWAGGRHAGKGLAAVRRKNMTTL